MLPSMISMLNEGYGTMKEGCLQKSGRILTMKPTGGSMPFSVKEKVLKTREAQHAALLQDYVQKDIKIAELEAELAKHRQYLEGLRLSIQRQEHQGS